MSKRRTDKKTYTKKVVQAVLIIGVMGGITPFILSAFGREPVSELGIAWVTEIVAVCIGYFCKAYFETKQERKQRLEDYLAVKDNEEDNDAVG